MTKDEIKELLKESLSIEFNDEYIGFGLSATTVTIKFDGEYITSDSIQRSE